MQWFHCIVISGLVLCCSQAATINRPKTSDESTSSTSNSILPWKNLISFVSYFATSTPSSYDSTAEDDYYQDDCKEDKPDSSETVIVYDVEEQILTPKNSTNATSVATSKAVVPSRQMRSTKEPTELTDDSEARHKDVRPYPGYFLGRKLWYVPLWFGIYYSFYLLCLVVKSVARHRISYPALLPADATLERKRGKGRQKNKKYDSTARRISESIDMYSNRYRPYK